MVVFACRMSLPSLPLHSHHQTRSPFISPFAINHSAFRSSAAAPSSAEAELHKLGKQWHILLARYDRAQLLHNLLKSLNLIKVAALIELLRLVPRL